MVKPTHGHGSSDGPAPSAAQAIAIKQIRDRLYHQTAGGQAFGQSPSDPPIRSATLEVLFRRGWIERAERGYPAGPPILVLTFAGRRAVDRLP